MRKLISLMLLALITSPAYAIPFFNSESSARAHCPSDTVVWVNTKTGVWHLKGERWYANTKYGAFACEGEAMAGGDRETRNGQ